MILWFLPLTKINGEMINFSLVQTKGQKKNTAYLKISIQYANPHWILKIFWAWFFAGDWTPSILISGEKKTKNWEKKWKWR